MTRRLRAGVLIDSEVNGKPHYFGYLTHPSMEYDIAVAFTEKDLKGFAEVNKLILPTDEPEYKFGVILPTEDRDKNNAYTCKVFASGKLHNLVIYPRQYNQIVTNGHSLNAQHEGRIFTELITA
jgi:hypothetical protein